MDGGAGAGGVDELVSHLLDIAAVTEARSRTLVDAPGFIRAALLDDAEAIRTAAWLVDASSRGEAPTCAFPPPVDAARLGQGADPREGDQ